MNQICLVLYQTTSVHIRLISIGQSDLGIQHVRDNFLRLSGAIVRLRSFSRAKVW